MLESRKAELPCYLQWQNLQSGLYALGLEPATNHVQGKTFARERGELIWLGHDEAREYHLGFTVLSGAADIAKAEKRIAAVHAQPKDDYPEPSDKWPKL